jgi:O-antigen ligase
MSGQRSAAVARPMAAPPRASHPPTSVRVLTPLAFGLLYLFCFSIPLENSIVFPGFGTIGRVVGVAAFAAGILALVEAGKVRPPSGLHLVMVGYVAWVAMSYFWSVSQADTVEQIVSYVQLLVMVWLIWQLAQTKDQQARLMQAYIFGTVLSAIATILLNRTAAGGRQGGFNMNINDVGLRLVLSVPMSLYLAAREHRVLRLWLYRAHIVVVVCALFFTASRGAFLAFLASLFMVPLTFRAWTWRQKMAMAAVIVAAGLTAAALVPKAAWERLGTTQTEITQGTMDDRTTIWHAGMDVFLDHPYTGVGAGAFGFAVEQRVVIAWVAHNTFLSVLVEQGIVGFSIFLVMLSMMVYGALKMPRLERGLWLVMMLTWSVGVAAMTWEYYKPTWFVFGLVAAQIGAFQPVLERRQVLRMVRTPQPARQPSRLPTRFTEFWNANFSHFQSTSKRRNTTWGRP